MNEIDLRDGQFRAVWEIHSADMRCRQVAGIDLAQGLGGASWAILPALVVALAARMVWRVWRLNRGQHFDPNGLPSNFAPL
ncbi:MAG TPA: hypothetical protein VN814_04765 [Caulobacteraceae bacterium]|nr:hypothetical protein [Caulobacteraceae bacterium]